MFIEMESIENGIVQLISELGIRKLVMGAAADRHYSRYAYRNQKAFFGSLLMHIESILVDLSAVSLLNILNFCPLHHLTYRRMTDLKSRKAIFVRREAPNLCQIWFTCKGYLIHSRFGQFFSHHNRIL